MTKEQLKRAKAIEEELICIEVAVKGTMETGPQGVKWDGVNTNFSAAALISLKYKADSLKLLNERKAELEAEFANL